jgi:hypothetical protein
VASANAELRGGAYQNDADAIRGAISRGAEPDHRDDHGNTPLLIATAESHVEAVKLLLSLGAKPNIPSSSGTTPLHLATHRGDPAVCEVLLAGGADPFLKQKDGTTPLSLAAQHEDIPLMKRVVEHAVKRRAPRRYREIMADVRLYWKLLGESPFPSSAVCDVLRRLQRDSSCYALDFLHWLHAFRHPKRALKSTKGALGDISPADARKLAREIDKKGCFTFPNRLPEDACHRLLQVAETQEANLYSKRSPDAPNRALFSRAHPQANAYLYSEEDLLRREIVQDMAADPSILAVVQEYLGCQPMLWSVSLRWTLAAPENSRQIERELSQGYHFDPVATKWICLFLYLTDVNDRNGPHSYVAGTHRAGGVPIALLDMTDTQLPDDVLKIVYPAEDLIELVGPARTLVASDTRGLHKGKPLLEGDRLVFILTYSDCLGIRGPASISIDPAAHRRLQDLTPEFPRFLQKYRPATPA